MIEFIYTICKNNTTNLLMMRLIYQNDPNKRVNVKKTSNFGKI